jgi:AraC-like DNA-binding protein
MFEYRENFNLRFFAFPQYGSTLEIFENTKITRTVNKIKLKPYRQRNKDGNAYAIEIFGKYTEPVFLNYEGYVNGFAINFRPLGINYFFDKAYSEIAPENFQKISHLKWNQFSRELFTIEKFEKRVAFAEHFLEKSIREIDLSQIEKAVDMIIEDPAIEIDEVADLCKMNTRNLLRKFNKYVGCPPSVYKRIVRFRKTIDFNGWEDTELDYMDICYNNNFFDTSHFRKEFLKLTHQNPSDFFKTISKIGNHQFPYKLL